ncbi:MAG TPA: hypothetical protein VLB76_25535 [Thermoanaerobaculia bacterium]|nr:hypothetical protein [Thermoanaerobaculia bacterium]
MPNRSPQSIFTVFALLALLVLASLPAQARPLRHRAAGRHAVAASGENGLVRIWSFLLSLTTKEGVTIDPNGAPKPQGLTTAPGGDLDDEGITIDPDGRT